MKVQPCPFCGEREMIIVSGSVRLGVSTRGAALKLPDALVYCGKCGARGPSALHANSAIDKWNERA
jgi:Lar family restriction alleviation protein